MIIITAAVLVAIWIEPILAGTEYSNCVTGNIVRAVIEVEQAYPKAAPCLNAFQENIITKVIPDDTNIPNHTYRLMAMINGVVKYLYELEQCLEKGRPAKEVLDILKKLNLRSLGTCHDYA